MKKRKFTNEIRNIVSLKATDVHVIITKTPFLENSCHQLHNFWSLLSQKVANEIQFQQDMIGPNFKIALGPKRYSGVTRPYYVNNVV